MSTDVLKELREATNQSFTDIKKALTEADGDKTKALELLKQRGAVIAEKKSSRETKSGLVVSYIHSGGTIGVLLEVVCETDFVAKNPLFVELARDIAMHIAAMNPENNDTLLAQPYIKDASITAKDRITQAIAQIGENIKVSRFTRFAI